MYRKDYTTPETRHVHRVEVIANVGCSEYQLACVRVHTLRHSTVDLRVLNDTEPVVLYAKTPPQSSGRVFQTTLLPRSARLSMQYPIKNRVGRLARSSMHKEYMQVLHTTPFQWSKRSTRLECYPTSRLKTCIKYSDIVFYHLKMRL